jgi:two-component system, NtrC family, sensor kinase
MGLLPGAVSGELTVSAEDERPQDTAPARILLIDDNPAIHADIRKVLGARRAESSELDTIEVDLFGLGPQAEKKGNLFTIDTAVQGQEGVEQVRRAIDAGDPYAIAFVDIRMPPGWDGIETIGHIWQEDPNVQIVICSAFSDYSWSDIVSKLDPGDRLLVLRKPFDGIEIRQMAYALSRKWLLHREVQRKVNRLKWTVQSRTRDLGNTTDKLREQLREKLRLERELHFSQKLEKVGHLASSVAQDAADPVKAMADDVRLLRMAFDDLSAMTEQYQALLRTVSKLPGQEHLAKEIASTESTANLAILKNEIPAAFKRLIEGTTPLVELVGALRAVVRGQE